MARPRCLTSSATHPTGTYRFVSILGLRPRSTQRASEKSPPPTRYAELEIECSNYLLILGLRFMSDHTFLEQHSPPSPSTSPSTYPSLQFPSKHRSQGGRDSRQFREHLFRGNEGAVPGIHSYAANSTGSDKDAMGSPTETKSHENQLGRRDVLRLGATGAVAIAASAIAPTGTTGGAVAGTHRESKTKASEAVTRMPVIFAAHGNPMFMDDAIFMNELKTWADALPRPKAVLMVSAHWEAQPSTIGATTQVPLIYDFSGFPARYYQVKYPSPGAPWLADRVRALLKATNTPLAEAPRRGLDHGAYVPMICMYPKADVPVLQLSLPSMDAQEIFRLGMALSPLRDEGVLVIGSGFLTHNLGTVSWGPNPTTPTWTKEFDEWAKQALAKRDFDSLLDFQTRAPAIHTALPTVEHYVPVLLAAGASANQTESVTFPIEGFSFGTITKRSVQFG